jgi:uncharacterized protein YndB with AHSA1/START domain
MKKPSVEHASFSIERVYDASPARVFSAWSNAEAKLRWFFCDDSWRLNEHDFDFRVGGRERLSVSPPGGQQHIIYNYAMYVGESRISVSLATVTLEPSGRGTKLLFTEQGAFLDGLASAAEREEGTRLGLENLAAELMR